MIEVEQEVQPPPTNTAYWIAVGYAAAIGFWWLFVTMRRVLQLVQYAAILRANRGQIDPQLIERQQGYLGSVRVDLLFALGVTLFFAYALLMLVRRSWNNWDHATLAIGALVVLSLVFLCARGRIMFWIPVSAAPLLALLYMPQTKAACGVGQAEPDAPSDEPATALSREALQREIEKERTLIMQLSQNLDVFEVERAMDTDRFVARYTEGLEEDTPDNAEWFAIARAVRRSRERLQALRAQLSAISDASTEQ